jgi:hypothetical protein
MSSKMPKAENLRKYVPIKRRKSEPTKPSGVKRKKRVGQGKP